MMEILYKMTAVQIAKLKRTGSVKAKPLFVQLNVEI